jgi:hypothetical protein
MTLGSGGEGVVVVQVILGSAMVLLLRLEGVIRLSNLTGKVRYCSRREKGDRACAEREGATVRVLCEWWRMRDRTDTTERAIMLALSKNSAAALGLTVTSTIVPSTTGVTTSNSCFEAILNSLHWLDFTRERWECFLYLWEARTKFFEDMSL